MCYDISFVEKMNALTTLFPKLIFDEAISMEYTTDHILGHAYPEHPIIYCNRTDQLIHCGLMEWGVIPFYIKEEETFKKQRASMLNVRSERIFDDPKSYWYKIRNRRCLIPVTGFYEHRSVKGFKNKIPYHIGMNDKSIFYLPGLYSVANLPDKETGEMIDRKSFAILTTTANRIMQEIHNSGANTCRMPLIISDEHALRWLEEDILEADLKEILKYQIMDAELNWHPVFSIRTNKQREDDKSKNEPYVWPGLEPLV